MRSYPTVWSRLRSRLMVNRNLKAGLIGIVVLAILAAAAYGAIWLLENGVFFGPAALTGDLNFSMICVAPASGRIVL